MAHNCSGIKTFANGCFDICTRGVYFELCSVTFIVKTLSKYTPETWTAQRGLKYTPGFMERPIYIYVYVHTFYLYLIYVYVYIYIYIHIHIYIYLSIDLFSYLYIYIYVDLFVYCIIYLINGFPNQMWGPIRGPLICCFSLLAMQR